MKLAYKVLIVISIISFISISVLSYITFTFTKSSVSESIKSSQIQLARQTMDKIDRLLNERSNNVQTIAGDQTIEDTLINIDKRNLPVNEAGNASPEFIKRVQELSTFTGPWDDIDVITSKGVIIYSLGTQSIGENIQNEPLHKKIFEKALNGDVAYSDAEVDPETKKPTLIFAIPIRNDSDPFRKVVGVVITHLSWPVVSEILESITGSTIDLYNNQGIEIANNNNPSVLFKENNSDEPSVKAALQGKEISVVAINNKEKIETVSSSVTEKGFLGYKGNKWVLLINQPTSIAFAPAVKAATTIIFILIPIFIITNIIFLLFIIQMLRPIELLIQTILKIAGGDFSKRVQVTSRDEIGQLGTAFNDMAEKLQELYRNLEQKVKEKTTQLSLKMKETEEINKFMVGREIRMEELKKENEQLQEQIAKLSQTEIHNTQNNTGTVKEKGGDI